MKLKTELSPRKCQVCGCEFIPKTLASYYCSRKCTQTAYKNKKKQEKEEEDFKALKKSIPDTKKYLTVEEACLLYCVSKRTLYRLIKNKTIPSVNLAQRRTRVLRTDIEKMFDPRETVTPTAPKVKRLYSLEPEDCYTIGEIKEKYKVSESTVYKQIRQNAIPIRQIGKFVYAPKQDIDEIFK